MQQRAAQEEPTSGKREAAYRGVGAVAEATGVELGVLDGVGGQVHLQAGGVRVRAVTAVALERLILVVLPSVGLVN